MLTQPLSLTLQQVGECQHTPEATSDAAILRDGGDSTGARVGANSGRTMSPFWMDLSLEKTYQHSDVGRHTNKGLTLTHLHISNWLLLKAVLMHIEHTHTPAVTPDAHKRCQVMAAAQNYCTPLPQHAQQSHQMQKV